MTACVESRQRISVHAKRAGAVWDDPPDQEVEVEFPRRRGMILPTTPRALLLPRQDWQLQGGLSVRQDDCEAEGDNQRRTRSHRTRLSRSLSVHHRHVIRPEMPSFVCIQQRRQFVVSNLMKHLLRRLQEQNFPTEAEDQG